MQRIEIMGCPMDYATMAETVETIRTNIASGSFTQHVVVNVAKLVNMQTDPGLRESVQACDCSRRLKTEPPCRLKFEPGAEADFEMVGCG